MVFNQFIIHEEQALLRYLFTVLQQLPLINPIVKSVVFSEI